MSASSEISQREAAFEALDRHDAQRLVGDARVSTVVASGEAAALTAAFAWANARAISVVEGCDDVAQSVRRWFVTTLAAIDPLLIVARPIATRHGVPVSNILNRLRDDALFHLPTEFRAALPSDVATNVLVSELRFGASPQRMWDDARISGAERGVDALDLFAAANRLLMPDRGPMLVFSLASSDDPRACVEVAASLAEAAPLVRVVVVSDDDAYARSVIAPDVHAAHLLREATVRVANACASGDPHVANSC